MIERIVENWLTSVSERGFELPFAQVLASEDHRIIQGPVHHPYEHGKDILAFSPNGDLHAYQLKGPNLVRLEDFERIQPQLLALSGTAITHPAVTPPRRADRVFLVTNARLTPPVRDRIEKFNISITMSGWPPIEPIEFDQLSSKFLAAHGKFLPQTLHDIRTLLDLYYSDPVSLFPVRLFARYLDATLPTPAEVPSSSDCRRAIASVTLLTAYAAASWIRAENHFCTAQAWLTACITIMRFASVHNLELKIWRPSYELAFEASRAELASLSREAAEAADLLIPDLTDGLVYSSRALLVCGFLSAYLISERTLGSIDDSVLGKIQTVIAREAPWIEIAGESAVPAFFLVVCALGQIGDVQKAEDMMLSLVFSLCKRNRRHSPKAFADPYHEIEQALLHQIGEESDLDDEEFDGRSYMLNLSIEWLARRLHRQPLTILWPDITQVQFLEFQPSSPSQYLAVDDDRGNLKMWSAGQPQSWAALLGQARAFDPDQLPALLWRHRELIPYIPLLFPYRLTSTLAHAIDQISVDCRFGSPDVDSTRSGAV